MELWVYGINNVPNCMVVSDSGKDGISLILGRRYNSRYLKVVPCSFLLSAQHLTLTGEILSFQRTSIPEFH